MAWIFTFLLAKAMPELPLTKWEHEFGFLIDFEKRVMRVDEAARLLGRSFSYVYRAIEEGDLEAHRPRNRERQVYRITRRSLALHFAETATYKSRGWLGHINALLGEMTEEQLDAHIKAATTLKRRKFAA